MFTPEQIAEMQKPLMASVVKERAKAGVSLSYVEGWHVIAEANRIFGFDGWTRETVELIPNCEPTTANNKHVVSFRAKVRIIAHGVVREGTGFGSGIASSLHDAYEGAIKEAETDAMKRALMTFGNPFGLALYDKTQSNVVDDMPSHAETALEITSALSECKTPDELKSCYVKHYKRIEALPKEMQAAINRTKDERKAALSKPRAVA